MDVRTVSFDFRKAYMRSDELQKVRFDVCRKHVEVRIIHFVFCKACNRLVEIRRVRFDNRNVCFRLEEVG